MGLDQHRHRRPDRSRAVGRPARVQPRLPRQRAVPRVHVRRLGPPDRRDVTADGVRPRRHPARLPRQARAAVLVLLRLQRLEQQARGRLGEHPAPVQRIDRRAGLSTTPYEVGYSQHESSERAKWGSAKLQIVDGTHPVVYPSLGLARELLLRQPLPRPKRGPGRRLRRHHRPVPPDRTDVAVVPQASSAYLVKFPWLGFQGRWGERQRSILQRADRPQRQGQLDRADQHRRQHLA